jgi:hypothetical protein
MLFKRIVWAGARERLRPLPLALCPNQYQRQELPGVAVLYRQNRVWRGSRDDLVAAAAALESEIDDPIGVVDDRRC